MEVPNLFAVSVYGWVAKTTRVHWPVTEQLRVQSTGGVQREEEEKKSRCVSWKAYFLLVIVLSLLFHCTSRTISRA
jgi:hypothetical protein